MEQSSQFTGFVVFADLKGFSSMDEYKYEEYETTLKNLNNALSVYKKSTNGERSKAVVWNTWGDALLAVFEKGIDACNFMLMYRSFFQKNKGLDLVPRIAAHYGSMRLIEDPLLNGELNVLGDTVNLAARIEPITFPGEIYVTEQFKEALETEEQTNIGHDVQPVKYNQIFFQNIENWDLPKNYKIKEIQLFRCIHIKEIGWNINALFVKQRNTTLTSLYNIIDIEAELKIELNELRQKVDYCNNKEDLMAVLEEVVQAKLSGPQYYALAKVYQEIGEYELALYFIQKSQRWIKIITDHSVPTGQGILTRPLRSNSELLKLKADCLSKSDRRDKYAKAKRILYEVLQMKPTDSDALCKLAAQYKREALHVADEEAINLLTKALDLYLEAFRLTGDYYPAINIAYIKSLLNHSDSWQLAHYIFTNWQDKFDENWWMDTALAESQMLMKDFTSAETRFIRAVQQRKPSFFQMDATKQQIMLYRQQLVQMNKSTLPSIENDLSAIDRILAILNYQN